MNVRARFTFVLALSLFPQVPGIMPYHRSYVHMAYALCTNGSFRYKMHMPCVPRPPLSTKEIVRAHDFIGSLTFREMVVGGGHLPLP